MTHQHVDSQSVVNSFLSFICNFFFPKENFVGKPKGCFPTFVDSISSKSLSVN
jgi:hypothetical protein